MIVGAEGEEVRVKKKSHGKILKGKEKAKEKGDVFVAALCPRACFALLGRFSVCGLVIHNHPVWLAKFTRIATFCSLVIVVGRRCESRKTVGN